MTCYYVISVNNDLLERSMNLHFSFALHLIVVTFQKPFALGGPDQAFAFD